MRTRGFSVVVVMVAVSTLARGEGSRPIAKWAVLATPMSATSGVLTYAVAQTGRTVIPVPGSGWFCAATNPTAGVDAQGRYEDCFLICALADGHSAGIHTRCRAGASEQLSELTIVGPAGGQDYRLKLACTLTDTAKQP